MDFLKNKFICLFFLILTSCSSIPSNTANSCKIFDERYLWYKHTKKVEQKWGTPIYIQLAIIKMESNFDWLAKPPRKKIFKIIPFKRPSTSHLSHGEKLRLLLNNIFLALLTNSECHIS